MISLISQGVPSILEHRCWCDCLESEIWARQDYLGFQNSRFQICFYLGSEFKISDIIYIWVLIFLSPQKLIFKSKILGDPKRTDNYLGILKHWSDYLGV